MSPLFQRSEQKLDRSFFDTESNSPSPVVVHDSEESNIDHARSSPLPRDPRPNNSNRRSFHFGISQTDASKDRRQGEKDKRDTGIRGFLRRASVSMKGKGRQRRNTLSSVDKSSNELPDYRPTTSMSTWHKLRGAASFRNSRSVFGEGSREELSDCQSLECLTPGNGDGPPCMPIGDGGAGIQATTTSLNGKLVDPPRRFPGIEDTSGDGESGVGIAITVNDVTSKLQEVSISRVDFLRDLPTELAIQIVAHLDYRSLARVAMVSSAWSRAASDHHVWRQTFCREQSGTYATGHPLLPGTGHGIPSMRPDRPWKQIYKAKHQLQENWRTGNAKAVYLHGHLDSIYCVQFDENKILTGSRDKTIRVWNMHTYKCNLIIGPPEIVKKRSIMVAEDGSVVHTTTLSDGRVSGGCIPNTLSYKMHHNASILCLQYDDRILATGSSDGTCIIHDIKDNYRPLMQLRHHTAAILDLAFDDRYIVTCSKDVTICVWDRLSGEMLKQLRGHAGPVNAVQLRGNTVVSCSGDFTVKLWNIDTGKNIREFAGHTKGLACSQFSDDSRYIASAGNDKAIRIWDANTGECLQKITAHDNLVRSLHIDSVTGRLISGSYDQDIKVFDMETGRTLLDFPKWHASWVLGAKSDYRRIVSTGQDPKICIMDFGHEIANIELLESVDRMENVAPLPIALYGEGREGELPKART